MRANHCDTQGSSQGVACHTCSVLPNNCQTAYHRLAYFLIPCKATEKLHPIYRHTSSFTTKPLKNYITSIGRHPHSPIGHWKTTSHRLAYVLIPCEATEKLHPIDWHTSSFPTRPLKIYIPLTDIFPHSLLYHCKTTSQWLIYFLIPCQATDQLHPIDWHTSLFMQIHCKCYIPLSVCVTISHPSTDITESFSFPSRPLQYTAFDWLLYFLIPIRSLQYYIHIQSIYLSPHQTTAGLYCIDDHTFPFSIKPLYYHTPSTTILVHSPQSLPCLMLHSSDCHTFTFPTKPLYYYIPFNERHYHSP